ncbi:MAG: hypothetical protein GX613_02050 [Chloroflexi bacterium]|nr:hypothetical protein [Chloroflexota bacterium]
MMPSTVLDVLFAEHALDVTAHTAAVSDKELVHVFGTQEPVRDQPDDRARALLSLGWLAVELIDPGVPEEKRASVVTALQHAARAWLKQVGQGHGADKEQVRWLIEKTRSHESKQLIAQRVWLALVIYSLGHRGLRFDAEGGIWWDDGHTLRIGVPPDDLLDLAATLPSRAVYTASFRQPTGVITRGKGRNRWHTYRVTIAPEALPLFERRAQVEREAIALIVASETFGSQPMLPRDFYGGNDFQQACIDAQDQQFAHILVLSPEHGILSLDDIVPSEVPWDDVLDWKFWPWQINAHQRLASYLVGRSLVEQAPRRDINWWAWLNPASVYECVVYGAGFPVDLLIGYMQRMRQRFPDRWPQLILRDQRPGYDAGELDDPFVLEHFGPLDESDADWDEFDPYDDLLSGRASREAEIDLTDVDQLLAWAGELVTLVNVPVPTQPEPLVLEPDEALVPVRLLAQALMDIDDMLDLLADMSLLLEQPIPFTMLINAPTLVSALIQVAHSLVHDERDAIPEILASMPESTLQRYIDGVLLERSLEDQLCGCLTLAEQAQLFAMSVPQEIIHHLATWLQTYLAGRLRQDLLSG